MYRRLAAVLGIASLLFLGMAAFVSRSVVADEGDSALVAMADPGVQEQIKGPVHEAFEKPGQFNPTPGIIVDKKPPELIEEVPPEEKPEGENISWIGGYWGWDESRVDFLWISGFWRAIPAGREWKGGFWKKVGDETAGVEGTGSGGGGAERWQWFSGYWASIATTETEYHPEPPKSLEAGPTSEAPGEDYIYSPGSWVWYETRFAWRPGFWILNHPGWVYYSGYWVLTPCGYVYVDGYWDYSLRSRGMLFAPCYFDAVVFSRPRFFYRPRVVIDIDILTDHFFCFPHYHHCCFGDYYADTYVNVGITPWFSFHYSKMGYSPTYAYYHCHFRRHDPHWEVRMRSRHDHLRINVASRPAKTYLALEKTFKSSDKNAQKLALAKPLSKVSELKGVKLAKVDTNEQKVLVNKVKESRKAQNDRLKLESAAALKSPLKGSKNVKPIKLATPKSPIASKVTDDPKLTKGLPPKPKITTKIDSTVKTKTGTTPPTLDPKASKLPKTTTVDPKTTKSTVDPKTTTKIPKTTTVDPKTTKSPMDPASKLPKTTTVDPKTKSKTIPFDPKTTKSPVDPKSTKSRIPTDPTTDPNKAKTKKSSELPTVTPNSGGTTTFTPITTPKITEKKSSEVKSTQSTQSSKIKSSSSSSTPPTSNNPTSREEKKRK